MFVISCCVENTETILTKFAPTLGFWEVTGARLMVWVNKSTLILAKKTQNFLEINLRFQRTL